LHRTLSAAGAFWLAAFTYFIWGFTFLASRIAQDYGTPFVLLFWRFALAFLLLNLLRLTRRFPVRFRSRKLWPVLLAGLFEPVLYFPCEQYGLKLTSTSFSGVMVALIPLCSLVYGAVFLHAEGQLGVCRPLRSRHRHLRRAGHGRAPRHPHQLRGRAGHLHRHGRLSHLARRAESAR